jgi:hypothetical protein
MAIYKSGKVYWYKFRWNGELIRESTKQKNEKAGGDVFVLARIAGHSSISVTQRYIHPQATPLIASLGRLNHRWAQNWAHPENGKKRRTSETKNPMTLKSA